MPYDVVRGGGGGVARATLARVTQAGAIGFDPIHLRRSGVSLVIVADGSGAPTPLHWGADLGDLSAADLAGFAAVRRPGVSHSAFDHPRHTGLAPDTRLGFTGTPAVEGFRTTDGTTTALPRLVGWLADSDETRAALTGADAAETWRLTVELELTDAGLVRARTSVANTAAGALHLQAVRTVLPVGPQATELLDLTGRWCRERTPQRHDFVQGRFERAGRHGRTGHDATLLLIAGTPGFGFRDGEVWGVHVAWSGDHASYAERTPEGDCLLGGGELPAPGEIALGRGQSYESPWLLGSWSGAGLDAMSARLHAEIRAARPATERRVIANTWEAAYFDHDLAKLAGLADRAAAVGVERFVLDDGWFAGRRSDHAGLGDWTVDRDVWPDGLHPLVDHVRGLGMDFGLWVEPEMVNLDSDLVRSHPDWVLGGVDAWRHQHVLDLQQPGAYAHVRDALLALLAEYPIGYLKWDHNRDVVDAVHDGTPAVHGQTLALYRLLDELRAAHPGLEIESCASGGGRVDAGVLARTDRIWPSDTIDAVERQHIQRWTSLLVPPELIGSHVGGPEAHTTGRSHRLGLRAATALLYDFGIEWDLTALGPDDLTALGRWIALHKRVRPVIAGGTLVHVDHPDPAVLATGVVSPDRREAWYVVAAVAATATQHPYPVRLAGLDRRLRYRLVDETPPGQHSIDQGSAGGGGLWTSEPEGITLPGSVAARAGVRLPATAPDTARVWHAVAL